MRWMAESKVYLMIEDPESLTKVIRGAVKSGYLRRMDLRDVISWMQKAEYPIRIPVNLDSVMATGQNTIVKGLFGKSIDATVTKYVKMAMGTE